MYPLLAASVLAVALILERAIIFAWSFQRFGHVVGALRPLISRGSWDEAEAWCRRRGPFTHLALVFLENRDQPPAIREDVMRREGMLALSRLETRLRWLAALAQVSTLLGLLGTFYFMIYRFHPDATAGGQIAQAEFYAAIWESFLSTMFGLIVAIPCTVAYQVFEGRVDSVSRDLSVLTSYLEEWRRITAESAAKPTPVNHYSNVVADPSPEPADTSRRKS
jgi:biopolymer transport protein ExbB